MKNEYEKVGRLNGMDVYWYPQWGLAIERDHMHPVEMTPEELAAWRSQEEETDQREGPSSVTNNVRLGREEY